MSAFRRVPTEAAGAYPAPGLRLYGRGVDGKVIVVECLRVAHGIVHATVRARAPRKLDTYALIRKTPAEWAGMASASIAARAPLESPGGG